MEETAQGVEPSTQAPVNKTPVYEVGFHVVPTVGDDGVAAVVEKLRKTIAATTKEGEVEFIAEAFPQKMQLAYIIERATQGKREKYNEAYFGWIKFATEREGIPALEAALRDMKEILRSIIINTTREDLTVRPSRAVFASDRLEGQTLKKPVGELEKPAEISEEELDKSIEALVTE